MRGKFPNISHSLDVWHKAKEIPEKLGPLAKRRENTGLLYWIRHIKRHLYWCVGNCNQNPAKLEKLWLSMLEHVTDNHQNCLYGNLELEVNRTYLTTESSAFKELKDFSMSKSWLADFPFLVNNRHTSYLECFHNVILKYASKRIAYRSGYTMRIALAILDWNYNVGRNVKYYTRKWNKRTKAFSLKTISEPKEYKYLNPILENIIEQVSEVCITKRMKNTGTEIYATIGDGSSCSKLNILQDHHMHKRNIPSLLYSDDLEEIPTSDLGEILGEE